MQTENGKLSGLCGIPGAMKPTSNKTNTAKYYTKINDDCLRRLQQKVPQQCFYVVISATDDDRQLPSPPYVINLDTKANIISH